MYLPLICRMSPRPAPPSAASQSDGKKGYTPPHINPRAPAIDGRLDDSVWEKVGWEGGFIQFRPVERADPAEKTEFKILYDDANLYVGVRCWDSKAAGFERRVARRDNFEGDFVEVTLDSLADKLTGFAFAVQAAGVKGDSLYRDGA